MYHHRRPRFVPPCPEDIKALRVRTHDQSQAITSALRADVPQREHLREVALDARAHLLYLAFPAARTPCHPYHLRLQFCLAFIKDFRNLQESFKCGWFAFVSFLCVLVCVCQTIAPQALYVVCVCQRNISGVLIGIRIPIGSALFRKGAFSCEKDTLVIVTYKKVCFSAERASFPKSGNPIGIRIPIKSAFVFL